MTPQQVAALSGILPVEQQARVRSLAAKAVARTITPAEIAELHGIAVHVAEIVQPPARVAKAMARVGSKLRKV